MPMKKRLEVHIISLIPDDLGWDFALRRRFWMTNTELKLKRERMMEAFKAGKEALEDQIHLAR